LFVWYKYGHIPLGPSHEKPHYSTLTYSVMIFIAGAGNGLLVYSVLETLSHRSGNFYAQAGYRSQDEIDVFAVNLAITGWGLGGWSAYTVVAVALSLAVYRFHLPMTYRSLFYPILGSYTWGWIGDVIDGLALVVTLFGIYPNLGLLAVNVAAGFISIEWVDPNVRPHHSSAILHAIIWVVTAISVASVACGLQGAKYCCLLSMAMSIVLLFIVFLHDDTKYLLNLIVQEVGYYLQTSILEINLWTDAFGQLREGSGRAVDGNAADERWMEDWFNYIQGWW
jgi:choline-glycine betaine transporter